MITPTMIIKVCALYFFARTRLSSGTPLIRWRCSFFGSLMPKAALFQAAPSPSPSSTIPIGASHE